MKFRGVDGGSPLSIPRVLLFEEANPSRGFASLFFGILNGGGLRLLLAVGNTSA